MCAFEVKIRTAMRVDQHHVIAESSIAAFEIALTGQGDIPCGITVTPVAAK